MDVKIDKCHTNLILCNFSFQEVLFDHVKLFNMFFFLIEGVFWVSKYKPVKVPGDTIRFVCVGKIKGKI